MHYRTANRLIQLIKQVEVELEDVLSAADNRNIGGEFKEHLLVARSELALAKESIVKGGYEY